MSNYQLSVESAKVSIPNVVNEENITYYLIGVQVDDVSWEVQRRYNDFVALHEKLVDEGIDRDVLPPKKLLGNKDPAFLMKRRKELEIYLRNIFHFLARNIPEPLADFLEFSKYDIHFIMRKLANQFHNREELLVSEETEPDGLNGLSHELTRLSAAWTPLEMYSVSQRVQHPCPPLDPESKRYDFTNVMDACCSMESLTLQGSKDNIGSSNLSFNKLSYDFLAFKSLQRLEVWNILFDAEHITTLGMLRSTLKELIVCDSDVKTVSEVLLCDNPHYKPDSSLPISQSLTWTSLVLLDISNNSLDGLDYSIRLAPSLETLILDHNSISNLDNLTGLPRLRRLSLSNNKISLNQELHTVLGQVTRIDLSHNKISMLEHFNKLYSLQDLNLSHNKVKDIEQCYHVCSLPCLEKIDFSQNKVNQQVDYRLKILEAIGTRCREVTLDGSRASQAELDKVSVLMALRVTREKKSPTSLFGNLPNSEQWKS